MPRCLSAFLAFLLWFACFGASAGVLTLDGTMTQVNASPQVRIFEDRTGTLTLDDVRSKGESGWWSRPVGDNGDLNLGYSRSVFWLRIDLLARDASRTDPWLLEIGFPTLDSVTFYGPLAGHVSPYQTGDLQPFSQRPMVHRHFVFPLALEAGVPETIYVRVASAGSITVPIVLWRSSALAVQSQSSYAVLAVYYGILLALGGYNLLLFFSLRDRVYLAYVGFVVAMVVGQLSQNGFGNQFLWPNAPQWGNIAYATGFAATGCLGAIFTRIFLHTAVVAPEVDKLIVVLIAGFALGAVGPLFMPYRWVGILTSVLGIAFSVAAVVAGCVCWRRGVAGARWFLLAWTLLLAGVALMALRNFGLVPTNLLTSEAMQVGSSLEMLLLSFALADRILVADREKKLAQADALDAKEQLVLSMSESERQLESRVVERTRDLASANRELEHARARLAQLAHYDPLTKLPNRLMLTERLDSAVARAADQQASFAVLWIDLDGFKAINDLHGHLVGDEVLRVLSRRMQEVCHASDLIVRFGGDEFVAILDGITNMIQAGDAAQRLIDCVNREVRVESKRLGVQASVGIALYPLDGADAQTLLEQADRAMYAAKAAGGCCWRAAEHADERLTA